MTWTILRMYAKYWAAVVLAAAALLPAAAGAQPGLADRRNGEVLAQRLCTNCHLVSPNAKFTGTQIAPGFAAIANLPGQTPERIAGRIIIPHPEMPAISLTMKELRDVVAYITSLRTDTK